MCHAPRILELADEDVLVLERVFGRVVPLVEKLLGGACRLEGALVDRRQPRRHHAFLALDKLGRERFDVVSEDLVALRERRVHGQQPAVVSHLALLALGGRLLELALPQHDLRLVHRARRVGRLLDLLVVILVFLLVRKRRLLLVDDLGQLERLLGLGELVGQIEPGDGEALVVARALRRDVRLEPPPVLVVVRFGDRLGLVLVVSANDAADGAVRGAHALEARLESRGVPLRRLEQQRRQRRLLAPQELAPDRAPQRAVVRLLVRARDRGVLRWRVGAKDFYGLGDVVVEFGGLLLGEGGVGLLLVYLVHHPLSLEHCQRDRAQVAVELVRELVDERRVVALLPCLLRRAHSPRVARAEELDEGILVD
mmetsp:Transcript_5334/g.14059  ORF Transcript_5334/g.14059 Transcript_5334/m.14059 type:complete len:369 (-) Transcript_5334:1623-2729(-)